MAGEDTTTRRAELAAAASDIDGADSKNDLISAIDRALAVVAPMGSPDTIESAAKAYKKAAGQCKHEVEERVEQVATKDLPQAWEGMASVTAQMVVAAAARTAEQMSEAFEAGQKALERLADGVRTAQSEDGPGRTELRRARDMLGGEDGFFDSWVEKDAEEEEKERAREIARAGVKARHKAAESADDAARAAARDLNKLAAEARSGHLDGKGLSAVDRMMLADTSNVGEDSAEREYNEILSTNDLKRSSDRLDKMSPAERAEFQKMLDGAGSPEERAYLMKGLAAGHDMNSMRDFSEKIAGKDEAWLRRHLSPVVSGADAAGNVDPAKRDNTFRGQQWAQGGDGSEGSCVASSTINARAVVDPVYALGLTGGPDGQEDSPSAFRDRLVDEQHRVHEDGDGDWDDNDAPDGMDNDGWSEVADNELNSPTGADYERQSLDSPDDRRGALPEIEKAVAEGKPVPIRVDGPDSAHALVIVGQEGDMLQVHNPWGHTVWVSESDFVDGHMDKASDGRLPDATGVHLPK
ncbi:WXG100 family type VII secretion target [Streptomyces sp. NBC_01304]|uniref:WXG100 family type VII secretion target n=1 Tax=Streptomyces sp. NBC_01304 TaxID=2903818 RepID=UPI002E13A05F|nr:WXG100 family type VII secretion target [Streptomyces sp. NBC_01304]